MGALTVEGTYRNGVVELDEEPPGAQENARVVVTFSPSAERDAAARQEALQRLLELFGRGFDLGGPPYPSREEIHDRVADRKRSLR